MRTGHEKMWCRFIKSKCMHQSYLDDRLGAGGWGSFWWWGCGGKCRDSCSLVRLFPTETL